MGRIKRIHYGSACYHVCARGNNRRFIFERNEAKEYFLTIVARYQRRMKFRIYAFVIMGNHFHLLLEVDELFGISKVMQGILLSFSIWYRRREKYVGHVWQGRFKSRLVDNEIQLAENIRYIHANPVRANMVKTETEYVWSSARHMAGLSSFSKNVCDVKISTFNDPDNGDTVDSRC